MEKKFLTVVSALLIFIPWTILPFRSFDWALESPVAEIMISSYAVLMVLGGVFTILSYVKAGVQNNLMKVCLVVNSLYAAGGIAALGMMVLPKIV